MSSSGISVIFALLLVIMLAACNSLADREPSKEMPLPETVSSPAAAPSPPEDEADYATLSEIELAAAISESIQGLVGSVQTAITITAQLTADGHLTPHERAEIQGLWHASQISVTDIDERIEAYTGLYAEISPESSRALASIAADLAGIDTIIVVTDGDIGEIVEIDAQRQQALARAGLREKAQTWLLAVQAEIDAREQIYAQIQPQLSRVENHRVGAFTQAYEFMDAFQAALRDGKFSPDELAQISQMGANAQASFYSTGDPQLFEYAVSIDTLSSQAIRGAWPQARGGIVELRNALPARPKP